MAYNNPPRGGIPTAAQPPLTYGDSSASGPAPHTAGHHRHDILNKLDPAVDSSRDKVPIPPPGAASNGPHSSRLANKLDPRVDTRAYEATNFGAGAGYASGGMMGTNAPTMHGGIPGGASGGAPEGTYGPHNSRVANAMDPRVDSDRDRRGAHAAGGAGYQQQTGYTQQSGYGAGQGGYASQPQEGVGAGYGQQQQQPYGSAQQGYGMGHEQHYGASHHGGTSLPGPAPNTAGPHRSDLLNKLDPRVDSTGGMGNERGQRRGF